ncbi:phosphatidylinositol 3-kinase [Paragonimus westermani]|uniref:Phosphatidylinositol 3-kinase catalytic subunit type 3 n=1 Tax=Paragonimus westermani TaxID=34504 RepID=A0A5J4NZV9_9TREM|nr:phosphatidylinositol 3-kinase [Paragonimus westermani]
MGTLTLQYFASCDLGPMYHNESVRPCVKIMNLSGFHPEKYKTIKGQYLPLACYGELQVSYCITKNIPHLNCCVVSPWCQTRHSLDNRTFNETAELSLPYNALYDYNGICFVLTSTFTDEKGAHEQLIAGANMRLFNSKKIFRHGIYEIELHPLEPMGIRRFEDLERVIRKSEFDAKPAGMNLLNKLLKTSRKHIRNELFETPLDRHTRSDAERAIEEAKRDSGRLFLSVEFLFSRSHPNLNAPVIFERREVDPLVSDARSERWNPVDEKYFKMTRSLRIADVDRKRKPNKETLDRLKIALAKFLLAVRWEYSEQVDQAVELLHQWPIVDTDYVLELLNRQFIHPCVRRFAVVRLETAKDEELLLYLYQLVQALHYENWHDIFSTQAIEIESLVALERQQSHQAAPEELQQAECSLSPELHAGSTSSSRPPEVGDVSIISSSIQQLQPAIEHKGRWIEALKTDWKEDLATFLLRRAQSSWPIANYLYWFLRLEANKPNSPSNGMYTHVLDRLQGVLYAIEILRATLSSEAYANLARLDEPLALPLDPGVKIIGIDPSSSSLFKSARRPALLPFILPDGGQYKVIFKHGDDLRRDQLVLQMIELMDVILRKENFDLRLTPYKVLATGASHGFVQFIESTSLQELLQQGTVLGFLQQNAPSATDPLGVQKEVMETYIRSCAGYCVITYLLGVGDRHMENLLLTNDGRLFHIDFSFIFGNDPKPMATEVRLTRSMIEAMGGANTSQFSEFWKITFTAFLVLRRHANLFLTLFSLVSNMDVRSTSRDQSSACEFLKERFCINQTEERAVNRLASRMTESIKAIVPDIMERIHVLLQVDITFLDLTLK